MIRRSPVALLAAACVVAGCGGDDGTSKEDVVAEADRICREGDKAVEAIPAPQDAGEVGPYATKLKQVLEPAVAELKELDPPEEGRESFDKFVESADEQLKLAGELEGVQDEQRLRAVLSRAEAIDERGREAARAYGLSDCGEDSGQ